MKKFLSITALLLLSSAFGAKAMEKIIQQPDGNVILENEALKVTIATKGALIRSMLDKRSGREEVYNSVDKKFGSLAETRFGGTSARDYTQSEYKLKVITDTPDCKKIAFSFTPSAGKFKGIESRLVYTMYSGSAIQYPTIRILRFPWIPTTKPIPEILPSRRHSVISINLQAAVIFSLLRHATGSEE